MEKTMVSCRFSLKPIHWHFKRPLVSRFRWFRTGWGAESGAAEGLGLVSEPADMIDIDGFWGWHKKWYHDRYINDYGMINTIDIYGI